MEDQKNDYSLTLRVSRADILETALGYMGDTPMEIAENVWNELAETEIVLPMQLADFFAFTTRIVLGVTLVGRLKFPDNEIERDTWTAATILDNVLSVMLPKAEGQGPFEGGDDAPLPIDDIEGQSPIEVSHARFSEWYTKLVENTVTPVMVIGVSQGDEPGELYIWAADTLTDQDVVIYIMHAWKEVVRVMFELYQEGESDPPDESAPL